MLWARRAEKRLGVEGRDIFDWNSRRITVCAHADLVESKGEERTLMMVNALHLWTFL